MKKISQKILRILPITSIVLGTFSTIWGLGLLGVEEPFKFLIPQKTLEGFGTSEEVNEFFYIYVFILISLLGLFIGNIALKLKLGKIKAILGIIFSTIALIIWLFIWFWITGWSAGA